ncbi:transporter substrate-binding domain-containing protein [Effusibacillus consociatus]|uniref:Transporter substrate-binding domain-containing protein n=1 Tax=Effusibacillus consociatus TaxID=1117041 RepID=A0ABV9Q743_9BACL
MKQLKMLTTLALTAVLSLSPAACGGGGKTGKQQAQGQKPAAKKKIVMATSADFPPYEFRDQSKGQNEIVGFDIDIAKRIAGELGYELKIQDMKFNGLLPALQAGRADFAMAGITPTQDRKQNTDFSMVYYESKKGSTPAKAEEQRGTGGAAIAFPKGSQYVSDFNRVLKYMKDSGDMEQLAKKWFEKK